MNGVRLMLPFPDPILMPNKKRHWGTKKRAADSANLAAFYIAYNLHMKLDTDKKYTVSMVFCQPDKRARDLDNLVAAMKSALDGMCRALGINDKNIRPIPDWGPVVEGGKVEVVIEEIGT